MTASFFLIHVLFRFVRLIRVEEELHRTMPFRNHYYFSVRNFSVFLLECLHPGFCCPSALVTACHGFFAITVEWVRGGWSPGHGALNLAVLFNVQGAVVVMTGSGTGGCPF